eukprot:ANDGO_08118.mRNA.1 Kelch-like protein diablo
MIRRSSNYNEFVPPVLSNISLPVHVDYESPARIDGSSTAVRSDPTYTSEGFPSPAEIMRDPHFSASVAGLVQYTQSLFCNPLGTSAKTSSGAGADGQEWMSTSRCMGVPSSVTMNFADVILVSRDGVRYPAHKYLLASSSSFFKFLFSDPVFLEQKRQERERRIPQVREAEAEDGDKEQAGDGGAQQNVLLDCIYLEDIPSHLLHPLLEFLYLRRNPISNESAVNFLFLADKYQISSLKRAASVFIEDRLSAENALSVFRAGCLTSNQSLQDAAAGVLGLCIRDVSRSEEFLLLDPDTLIRILRSDSMCVKNELDVFLSLIEWLEFNMHAGYYTQEQFDQLAASLVRMVRFSMMAPVDLAAVRRSPFLASNARLRSIVEEQILQAYERLFIQHDDDDHAAAGIRQDIASSVPTTSNFSTTAPVSSRPRAGFGPSSSDLVLVRQFNANRVILLIRVPIRELIQPASAMQATATLITEVGSSEFSIGDQWWFLKVTATTVPGNARSGSSGSSHFSNFSVPVRDVDPGQGPGDQLGAEQQPQQPRELNEFQERLRTELMQGIAAAGPAVTTSSQQSALHSRHIVPVLGWGRSNPPSRPLLESVRRSVSYEISLLNRMDHSRTVSSRMAYGVLQTQHEDTFLRPEYSLAHLTDPSRGFLWNADSLVFRVRLTAHRTDFK